MCLVSLLLLPLFFFSLRLEGVTAAIHQRVSGRYMVGPHGILALSFSGSGNSAHLLETRLYGLPEFTSAIPLLANSVSLLWVLLFSLGSLLLTVPLLHVFPATGKAFLGVLVFEETDSVPLNTIPSSV